MTHYGAMGVNGVWSAQPMDQAEMQFLRGTGAPTPDTQFYSGTAEATRAWLQDGAAACADFRAALRDLVQTRRQTPDLPEGARAFWNAVEVLYLQ